MIRNLRPNTYSPVEAATPRLQPAPRPRHLRHPQFLLSVCVLASVLAVLPARAEPVGLRGKVITLEQAYDITLATDQSIQIAALEIRKANLLPWSALTPLGPQLTGNASLDTSHQTTFSRANGALILSSGSSFSSSTSSADTRRASLTLEQPLLDFTVFPAYRLGKLSALAAKLQHQFTVRQTLFGVAQAYYAVLKQQSVVAVNRETVQLAGQQLDLAQKRNNVGEVARTDVLRAQATLEDARRTLIEAEGLLETNRDTLSNILNFGGKTDFSVAEPANARTDNEPFDVVLARAYAQREDYQVSAIAIDQDIQRRNKVIAEYGPRVVAQASQNWNSLTSSSSSTTGGRTWDANIAVQVPFLTGGQREIDLRTAGYQISETRLNYEKMGKAIESEVKNAWLQVGTLRETLKALRAETVAAEQNYHDLETQYQAGAATAVDVQTALRDLNNSRTELIGATYDYQVALRNVQRAQAVFEQERVEKSKPK
jgi:outer membrane protein